MDADMLSRVLYVTSTDRPAHEDGRCHICLGRNRLTKEHVPPRCAFNNKNCYWERLMTPSGANGSARRIRVRGGKTFKTICQTCNNGVCSTYANSYGKLISHLVKAPVIFDSVGILRAVRIPCDTLMLAKQIATMILTVEPIAFCELNSDFREFVLGSV